MEEILEAISKAENLSAIHRFYIGSIFMLCGVMPALFVGIFMLRANNAAGYSYYPVLIPYGAFVLSVVLGVFSFLNFKTYGKKFYSAKNPKEKSEAFKKLAEDGLYYEFISTIDAELNDPNTVCYESDRLIRYDDRRKGFLYLWITPTWIIVAVPGDGSTSMGSFIKKHKNLAKVQLVMLNRNNSGIGFGFNDGGRSLISSPSNHKAILEILQKELPNVSYDL